MGPSGRGADGAAGLQWSRGRSWLGWRGSKGRGHGGVRSAAHG
uniref:Uncharacterized protein n=1 Tax=Arundo donax TaxID=35708 RepID=A0A0A9DVI4_ARUDO